MRKVKSVSGEYLNTDLGLISFKKWFERKIRYNNNIKFINSSFGAHIEGTQHMKLEDAEKLYMAADLDIRNRINIINNSQNLLK